MLMVSAGAIRVGPKTNNPKILRKETMKTRPFFRFIPPPFLQDFFYGSYHFPTRLSIKKPGALSARTGVPPEMKTQPLKMRAGKKRQREIPLKFKIGRKPG
jgi:hypothetical protein